MDNKQDRNFYWEVKDFMGKPRTSDVPAQKPNDMVSSIKNILEQNKLYKPSSFNPNINSEPAIRQAISAIERNNQKGTPENIQHTKNITSNPFGVIREGIFDEVGSPANPQFGSNLKNKFNLGVKAPRLNMDKLDTRTDLTFKDITSRENQPLQSASRSAPTPANPNAQSHQLPDGTWVDDNGNPVPGAPTPAPTPTSTTPTPAVGVMKKTTPTDTKFDNSTVIGNLRNARGTFVPTRTYGGAERESNKGDVQQARQARNDSIRSATIAANASRDELKAKWNAARAADPSSAETIALQKQLRSMNDEINPASPQQGNIRQSDIALRYAKRTPSPQNASETQRIADEFVASQKALKAGNTQPGVDVTQQTPAQTSTMNDPSKGGQSGTFGVSGNPTGSVPDTGADNGGYGPPKPPTTTGEGPFGMNVPSDDAINIVNNVPVKSGMPSKNPSTNTNSGQGSIPNNSGGIQNAEQPEENKKSQAINSKVAKITNKSASTRTV